MNYWEDNQWKPSREAIEIVNGAAVAQEGPHKVIFAANLNSVGAIDMLCPGGERLRSHVLGLAYTDLSSGQSVMIGEIKNCNGVLVGENEVYYQDAFDGDIVADVRYTYRLSGLEQDIIIVQAPPSPEEWQQNPATTRLEVWTEFVAAPAPTAKDVPLKVEEDPILRAGLQEPDLIDQVLTFGSMMMPTGAAFPLARISHHRSPKRG